MFFIFGWQKRATREGIPFMTRCHECRRMTGWTSLRVTEWLSVFFVRILPFRTQHIFVCDDCGDAIGLDAEEARGFTDLEHMEPDLQREWGRYFLERIEEHQLADMTPTQRAWHRSQGR
jgi:hypothetical protein